MPITAREFHLKSRPRGLPSEENFKLVERALEEPSDGQILVRNLWLSVDPYMRGRMADRKSYIRPFQIGEPMDGGAIGRVEISASAQFRPGDLVSHFFGWRTHALLNATDATKIPEHLAPAQTFLGALGIPGLTAYLGLSSIARAEPGNTVFISAGAGAVGSIACQIARLKGCRVVASAGSDAKIDWLRQIGAEAVVNYRTTGDFRSALAAACPAGVDVCFDNVGGIQLDAALDVANNFARFALCGMIEQYNAEAPVSGPRNLFQVVTKRLTLQGFLVLDHMQLLPKFIPEMARWIRDERIEVRETVAKGIERAPSAFLGLFSGDNVGKMLVDLRDDQSPAGC
jgi:NADPH-dependent curcumin reductase CurA